MPPKTKIKAKDAIGTRPLQFGVSTKIIRADAPPPPGLDTSYEKWCRQDYKTIPGGESHKQLKQFLLFQAGIRGVATGQQNQKNHFLKFLIMKYDQILTDDDKLPPTQRKLLSRLAEEALQYTNDHPAEVAALEATTGGEVVTVTPGLEMPPLQPLTGRLREIAEAADQELQEEEREELQELLDDSDEEDPQVESPRKRRKGPDHRHYDRSFSPSVPFPIVTRQDIVKIQ